MKDIVLPVPRDVEVQKAVFVELTKLASPLSAAMERTAREIELLREFRTRIINDVVTGRLDVREAAACLPDDPAGDIEPDTDIDDSELTDEEATEA